MNNMLDTPNFGILITLWIFLAADVLYRKSKGFPLLNPLIMAPVFIIALLLITGIPYEKYKTGGDYITFLVGPATVALGLPMYNQFQVLKKYWQPVLLGTFIGSLVSVLSVIFLGKILGNSQTLILSLVAKSTTTPIALAITQKIGGWLPIIILGVAITGLMGAVFGPEFLTKIGVHHPVARGVAMGNTSHAAGTGRALQEGETQGSLAGIAMVLAALWTSFIIPTVLYFW